MVRATVVLLLLPLSGCGLTLDGRFDPRGDSPDARAATDARLAVDAEDGLDAGNTALDAAVSTMDASENTSSEDAPGPVFDAAPPDATTVMSDAFEPRDAGSDAPEPTMRDAAEIAMSDTGSDAGVMGTHDAGHDAFRVGPPLLGATSRCTSDAECVSGACRYVPSRPGCPVQICTYECGTADDCIERFLAEGLTVTVDCYEGTCVPRFSMWCP